MDCTICMDIGGTYIKYALVNSDGTMTHLNKLKTSKAGREALLGQVFKIIEELRDKVGNQSLIGVGISTAGQVNHEKGKVLSATDNLPGWSGTTLRQIVEERYSIPCAIDNDVKCAALGEIYFGHGHNIKNFICITIGTGIGGAIIEHGSLIRGVNGLAGELGHMAIRAGGRKCNCGRRGCFEQYASVTALKRLVTEKLGKGYLPYDTGAEWLFERYDADVKLRAIIDQYGDYVAEGISSLIHILNPQAVVIGGAVSTSQLLMGIIKEHIFNKIMPVFKEDLAVLAAQTGNNASLLGVSTYLFN